MMKKGGKRAPEVRFKGFIDDWEQRRLGNNTEILTGGTPKTSVLEYWEPKEIPWMSSGEVNKRRLDSTDNMISKKGLDNSSAQWVKEYSVLIALAGQGKTRGTVAINRIPLTTNQSIAAIVLDETLHYEFIFQNLLKRYEELRMISSGDGTRGGLNKQLVSDIIIDCPNIEEQKTIGTFFADLDHHIALLQRKIDMLKQLKQGFLQQMFPQNGENVPRLRFANFKGEWEQRKLKDFVEVYVEKTTIQNQYPVLTSSQKYGIIYQEEYFADRQVTTENNIGYYVIPKGYFTFRSRSDNGVFKFNRNDLIDKGIVSYFYPVFGISNGNSNFFLYMLNSAIKKQVAIEAEGTGQRVLSLNKFKNINIMIPVIQEQTRIGNSFKQIDNTLDLLLSKLDKLQSLKKTYLQKMFI